MKWTIIKKFGAVVTLLFSITLIIVIVSVSSATKSNTIDMKIEFAKETLNQYKMMRGYYAKNVVSVVKNNSDIGVSMNHKEESTSIPLPATMILDFSEN